MVELSDEIKVAVIGAIVAAIVGAIFGGLTSIAVIEYQTSFDKKAAAEQMYIEITSMSANLQKHAYCYNKNLDLDFDGTNPDTKPNIDNILIIYANNSTLPPYIARINNSGLYVQQVDIKSINNGRYSWTMPDIDYPSTINTATLDTIIIPSPLYNEHGMYYLYAKDISNFDSKGAQDLYLFYNHIIKAESDRMYLQTSLYNNQNSSNLDAVCFSSYIDMRSHIIIASHMLPQILQDLENETK